MKSFVVRALWSACLCLSLAGPAMAQVPGPPITEVRSAVAKRFPEVKAEQLTPSPIPGLYEVRIGPRIAYLSADGRYLVQGEIIDLNTEANLTESRREAARRDALKAVSESSMVIFAPASYQSERLRQHAAHAAGRLRQFTGADQVTETLLP